MEHNIITIPSDPNLTPSNVIRPRFNPPRFNAFIFRYLIWKFLLEKPKRFGSGSVWTKFDLRGLYKPPNWLGWGKNCNSSVMWWPWSTVTTRASKHKDLFKPWLVWPKSILYNICIIPSILFLKPLLDQSCVKRHLTLWQRLTIRNCCLPEYKVCSFGETINHTLYLWRVQVLVLLGSVILAKLLMYLWRSVILAKLLF